MNRLGLATLLGLDLVLFAPLLVRGRVLTSHEFVRAHHPWRQTEQGLRQAENPLLADPAASGQTTLVRYRDFPPSVSRTLRKRRNGQTPLRPHGLKNSWPELPSTDSSRTRSCPGSAGRESPEG